MLTEKKKLVLALAGLVFVILFGEVIRWFAPNIMQTAPGLAIVLFVIQFIVMIPSMAYLTARVIRFLLTKIVAFAEQQEKLQLTKQQRRSRIFMIWLALACGFGLLFGSFNLPAFWTLSKRGVSTSGRELNTAQGRLIGYEFKIGQKIYKRPTPNQYTKTYPGARITVVYDPVNPQISAIGPIRERLANELISVSMVVLFFPPLIMLSVNKILLPVWKQEVKGNRFGFFRILANRRSPKTR